MEKSSRNQTISLSNEDIEQLRNKLVEVNSNVNIFHIENKTILGNTFKVIDNLPDSFVDLLFLDPPYNLSKKFGDLEFKSSTMNKYGEYFESWFHKMMRLLKPTASVYICGDWRSSPIIHLIAEKYLLIQNRITFEREKGRGAKSNWKNASEDIYFCTKSKDYTFNVDAVKLKKKVIAPYKNEDNTPKDWKEEINGNFRLTYPSNVWTDITIPFWSMPENTEHPTQKPEKLLAKIILASSNVGDIVFDPFLGSGTTSVICKKLGRKYVGIEQDLKFACTTEFRLNLAEKDKEIQGYLDGTFMDRNFAIK